MEDRSFSLQYQRDVISTFAQRALGIGRLMDPRSYRREPENPLGHPTPGTSSPKSKDAKSTWKSALFRFRFELAEFVAFSTSTKAIFL
jgi:hypothetical protein